MAVPGSPARPQEKPRGLAGYVSTDNPHPGEGTESNTQPETQLGNLQWCVTLP